MRVIAARSSVAVSFVAAFLLAQGCQSAHDDERKHFTLDDFKKISAGMSEADVKALLGRPRECLDAMGVRSLFWNMAEKYYSVACDDDGKVLDSTGPLSQAEFDDLRTLVFEMAAIEGTWDAIQIETDGKTEPADTVEGLRYQFLVKGRALVRKNKKDLTAVSVPYTINHKNSPKEITFSSDGMRAIYEIKGTELRLCVQTDAAKGQPTEFKTKEASGLAL